jgi:hypothetical protein
LFRDGQRLPVLIVSEWHDGAAAAAVAERDLIQRCLRNALPLLSVECAQLAPQIRPL